MEGLSRCHRLLLEYGRIDEGTEGHDVQKDTAHNSPIMLCRSLPQHLMTNSWAGSPSSIYYRHSALPVLGGDVRLGLTTSPVV
jgi:hypothetical protein